MGEFHDPQRAGGVTWRGSVGECVAPREVSAAPKKPGGAGICVTKPQPECNLILKAVCTKKSKCGGCLEWVCKL
jgi:hypothetical protein